MGNLTIRAKLLFLTFVVILGLGAIGIANHHIQETSSIHLKDLAFTSIPVIRLITLLDMSHDGIRGAALEAILGFTAKKPEHLASAQNTLKEHKESINNYFVDLKAKEFSSQTAANLKQAELEFAEYINSADRLILATTDPRLASKVVELFAGFEAHFEKLESEMKNFGDHYEDENKNHVEKAIADANSFKKYSMGIIIIVSLFTLIFAFVITKSIISNLKKATKTLLDGTAALKNVAEKMTDSSVGLSSTSQQQAAAIEQTSAATEEISIMVHKSSENSTLASRISQDNKNSFEAGVHSLKELVQIMSEISEHFKKITDITSLIDDIAFQTNLLALNASVEAARAGELGKGFAVVADAVQSLAQRSATAAKEISTMINENADRIGIGVSTAGKTNKIFFDVLGKVDDITGLNNEIAKTSQEQSRGVHEISKSINQLNEIAQHNADAAQGAEQSIGILNNEIEKMTHTAIELQSLIENRMVS